MGIAIIKSKRLQLTDWGQRPISPAALDYAATDVLYLLDLQRILAGRIESLRRTAWVAEECCRLEGVRYAEPDRETAYLSIKGAEELDPRSLAVLRCLYLFREKEARRRSRPPSFVMPDTALMSLAASPTTTNLDVPGLGPNGLQRLGRGIREALREGLAAAPVHRPPAPRYVRPGRDEMERLSRLREWRASLGASLSLDPSLLWPTPSLERLAAAPDSYDVEIASSVIRQWQRRSSVLRCLPV
jgi:ribonuclease D